MTSTIQRDGRATVLVVEDDVDLANLFAVWLGTTYTVEVAHDCTRAYELVDETVDVALLDRQLPDGTGGEILASIRDREIDCRVAMVSAVEPDVDIIEMGFDDYVCKPVAEEELLGTVEQLIAQGDYGDAITEYYGLATKKALLESHCSPADLADSEEFAALEARMEALDTELSRMRHTLSETQVAAELTGLSTSGVEG